MGICTIESPGPEATERIGRALGAELEPGTQVFLHGELGAGKTCLVRGIAQGLGCDPEQVSSPTFTLMQRYRGSLCDLVHVDAYRLHGSHDVREAGLDTLDASVVTAVEWPERVQGMGHSRTIHVHLHATDASERSITVEDPVGTLAERLAAAVAPRPCPSCGQSTSLFADHWPFCSPRCRSADLGRWLSGSYQISRPLEERDLDEAS